MSDKVITVVHLLRHGEVHNPEKVLYGRLPGYGLSTGGQRMAEVVAEHLRGRDIVTLVASPLQRAQATAVPIAAALNLSVDLDERLLEAENQFEGSRFGVGDGALRRPATWHRLRNPFRPSWGEPYRVIAARMLAAALDARTAAYGHEALCVSHQLPIWTLRSFLEGRNLWHDPRRRQCGLASLTSLTFEGSRFTGLRYTEPAGATDPDAIAGA